MPLLSEVIGKYIKLYYYTNSEKSGICPFHENHSLGSFMVNDKKNVWKCFSCGVSNKGNPKISFLMQYLKISENEANEILKNEFFDNTYSCYLNDMSFYKKKEKSNLNLELLNEVYSNIFKYSYLTIEDKRYLIERGITDFSYYCSFPLSEDTKNRIFYSIRELLNENFFVPGFYFDEYRNTWEISYFKGIGIKIYNAEKKLVGIQIRLNDNIKKCTLDNKKISKYIWFSSSKETNNIKYSNGCENNSPVEVIYPQKLRNKNKVIITEGHFKAEKLAKKGFISISLPGVTHWKKAKDSLFEISKYYYIYMVYIAFDADYIKNEAVHKCLINLLKDLSDNYNTYILQWDLIYGKGIDDLMQRTNFTEYLKVIPVKH